jgi:hypothetical protein
VIGSINHALPAVRHNYKLAAQTANTAQHVVDRKLAPLSSVADDFKASSIDEHAGFLRRLGETRASTLGEFQSRKVDAKAGAAFAVRAARDQFRGDKAKITDRLLEVKREQGAAFQTALSKAIDSEAQRALTRRGQDKTFAASIASTRETARGHTLTHQDKVSAANAKANKDAAKLGASVLAGNKPTKESQSSHNYKGLISDVQGLIHAGRGSKVSDHQIRANLLDGKNPSGKKYSRDAINAAFDLAAFGYLSRPNIAALRRRGVRIPKAWLPPRRSPTRGVSGRANA